MGDDRRSILQMSKSTAGPPTVDPSETRMVVHKSLVLGVTPSADGPYSQEEGRTSRHKQRRTSPGTGPVARPHGAAPQGSARRRRARCGELSAQNHGDVCEKATSHILCQMAARRAARLLLGWAVPCGTVCCRRDGRARSAGTGGYGKGRLNNPTQPRRAASP